MTTDAGLAQLLAARITDVPDYPKPGVMFKDITPLLRDHAAFQAAVQAMAEGPGPYDKVVGLEARGFVFGAPVALAAGVGFVPVRKAGKLPGETLSVSFELEYASATIEVRADAFSPGERVLVVDDVLATGGTVEAAAGLVRRAGAEVVGISVLMELAGMGARERLAGERVHALLRV